MVLAKGVELIKVEVVVKLPADQERVNRMKSAAILTIKDAGNMTKKGRKDIANWLRMQAYELEKMGEHYDGTVRARYLYQERN